MSLANKFTMKLNTKEASNKFIPVVTANDTTVFEFEVYDGKEKIELLETYNFNFVTKPIKTGSVLYPAELNEDGKVVVEVNFADVDHGQCDCALVMYEGETRVSTMRMKVDVKGDLSLRGDLPSESRRLIIADEDLLTRAVEFANDVEEAKGNETNLTERLNSFDTNLGENATSVSIIKENIGVTLGNRTSTETDDTGRLRRAIAAALTSERVVRLSPNKTYIISGQIDLPDKAISIVCDGNATIKAAATMDVMIKGSSFIEYPLFKGITLDGAGFANYCMWLESANTPYFEQCHFKNVKIAPLALGKTEASGITVYEARFSKMKITGGEQWNTTPENLAQYGILLLAGASDNHLDDILIKNIKIAGIRDQATNNRYGIVHIFGFPEPDYCPDYGIDIVIGRATVTGLYTDGVKKAGIKMRAGFNVIIGANFFWRFDTVWDKTQSAGIEIDSGVSSYIIANCIFRGEVGYDIRYLGTKSGVAFGNVSVSVLNVAGSHIYSQPLEFGSAVKMNNTLNVSGALTVGANGITSTGDITSSGKGNFKNGLNITQTNTANLMTFEMFGRDNTKYVSQIFGTVDKKRWEIQKNITTEDLLIVAYNDEGAQSSTPMRFIRSTGDVQVSNDLRVNTAGKGLVLTSPDGSKWKQTIDNAGVTSWVKM